MTRETQSSIEKFKRHHFDSRDLTGQQVTVFKLKHQLKISLGHEMCAVHDKSKPVEKNLLCTAGQLLLGHNSSKLPAVPCEHTTEEEKRLVTGEPLQHATVSCVSNRASFRGTLSPEWKLSGMPAFTEPNLSSGYQIDDNQTIAKWIKVIRPIKGSQTPFIHC